MKKTGIVNRIADWTYKVILVALVILSILLVGVRAIGYTPYVVLSGSMSPDINTGDLVYIKKTDPMTLKKGDVITFVKDEDMTVVTHRIADIDFKNDVIYTKGDSNTANDLSTIGSENVIGKVRFSIPYLGYVSSFLTSGVGRYVCLLIIFVLALILLIPNKTGGETNGKTKQNE